MSQPLPAPFTHGSRLFVPYQMEAERRWAVFVAADVRMFLREHEATLRDGVIEVEVDRDTALRALDLLAGEGKQLGMEVWETMLERRPASV